jgi:UDP-N-acetylglucosamine transferase subunit ALG13
VSLGTAQDFKARRILEAIVPILGPGGQLEQAQESPVEVLWQTGGTPADGLGIDVQAFVPAPELDAALAVADVVVAHAGTGTALSALEAGRLPILVPRDPGRGEIADAHQHLFAKELDQRGLALHREAEALRLDDVLEAATYRVAPAADPPLFRLRP